MFDRLGDNLTLCEAAVRVAVDVAYRNQPHPPRVLTAAWDTTNSSLCGKQVSVVVLVAYTEKPTHVFRPLTPDNTII